MDWYAKSPEVVLKNLKSSWDGLSEGEVQKRYSRHGKNVLKVSKSKSKFFLFFSQFHSFLIYILLAAVVISILLSHFIDAFVIFLIVILNGVIGFFQEYKAEEIIEKLKRSLKYKVLVLRDGAQKEIDSKMLVPGDIVFLSEGERVLADLRVIESTNLRVNESVLTGESFPVEKSVNVLSGNIPLADRKNMLYAGTTISKGKATAVVVETGVNTEFGKLAELVQKTVDEKMPLEKRLDEFSRNISIAIVGFVGFAFVVGILNGIDKVKMFLVSVSLAIGAIPEGLPAIIAITLAVAIKQMYKVNTLIRKLPAAETLGRATIICTDKTGTLTEEELTVDSIYSSGQKFSVDKTKKVNSSFKKLLEIGVLCNNARDEKDNILGDPTETALIRVAKKYGISKKKSTEDNPRVKEFPFDSTRKMMSIVREYGKIKTSYVKGAPSFILERCTKELVGTKFKPLSKKRKKEIEKSYKRMEALGLRVLGFGFRQIRRVDQKNAENHLIFVGFCGMIDPARPEVKKAIREAISAGIDVKVITGDAALTTKAIAERIGLKGEIIDGRELERIREDKWDHIVRTKTIFARITPEQKLKVVETLKKQKETVAVTGDGVNDILALKRADIGISMGVRGSDVARDSSDMVLLDDNFASIIKAVRQGRRVFDNIKKSLRFLLAANAGEVLVIVFAMILGLPLPFLPLAILWMNLVTDSLPALALAVEPAEPDVMERGPGDRSLFKGVWGWVLVAGTLSFISVILLFNYALSNYTLEVAQTMAISAAIFFELFFAFSCRSEKSLFKLKNNKWLIYAVVLSFALQMIAIYTSFGSVFGFVSLTGKQLGYSVLTGLSGVVVFESWKIGKEFFRR